MDSSADQLITASEHSSASGDTIEIKTVPLINTVDADSYNEVFTNLASPLSPTDIESILSSGPSSPENVITLHTIDTSQLDDSSQSSSDKSSQINDQDFDLKPETLKSSKLKDKFRSSPYDTEPVMDKKGRKKVQNKNAATRYRVKKRSEKEMLMIQEVELNDKNKELREKVESLQREIQYMKDLMNEINKAKRSNN